MKKILFTLVALMGLTMSVKAQNSKRNSYKGFFDIGYNYSIGFHKLNNFEINSSHGVQLNKHFFLGGGMGFHFMPKYKAGDFDIASSREKSVDIPIFADARLNITNGSFAPFLGVRGGIYITDGTGMYLDASVGLRIALKKANAINLSVGYTQRELMIESFDRFTSITSLDFSTKSKEAFFNGILIKIGYEI